MRFADELRRGKYDEDEMDSDRWNLLINGMEQSITDEAKRANKKGDHSINGYLVYRENTKNKIYIAFDKKRTITTGFSSNFSFEKMRDTVRSYLSSCGFWDRTVEIIDLEIWTYNPNHFFGDGWKIDHYEKTLKIQFRW